MKRSLYTVRLIIGMLDAAWGTPGDTEGCDWLRNLRELIFAIEEHNYASARQILKHVEASHP